MTRPALICVAAGRGERFGGDKLAARLPGGTVIERSLDALRSALPASPLVVVVREDSPAAWWRGLGARFPGARFTTGGPRRQDSVRRGLDVALELGAGRVLIHDAARPLVHRDDILAVAAALDDAAAVVLCARVADTVKRVDAAGRVVETLDRESLRLAQTPQGFRLQPLLAAWERVGPGITWTDEAMLMELVGETVVTVEARHPNPKVTTRADLALLRSAAGETA